MSYRIMHSKSPSIRKGYYVSGGFIDSPTFLTSNGADDPLFLHPQVCGLDVPSTSVQYQVSYRPDGKTAVFSDEKEYRALFVEVARQPHSGVRSIGLSDDACDLVDKGVTVFRLEDSDGNLVELALLNPKEQVSDIRPLTTAAA